MVIDAIRARRPPAACRSWSAQGLTMQRSTPNDAAQGGCHRSGVVLVALLVGVLAAPSPAAEAVRLSAARGSIRADDARRHVATLADDAFEGREGGSRGGRAAAAYIVDEIGRLGLQPAGDDGGYLQPFGGLRNILALAPGSDPAMADELIVVGAHYDHVGYGTGENSFGPFGRVHNGADDNASGVAGLIELMEAVQRLPTAPRRPILFAFWDGEEKGLLGSRHFLRVRPAAVRGKRITFAVNLDMIGRLRGERVEIYGARTARGLRSAVVRANVDPRNAAGLELVFDWDITDDSDHYPFIAAGVPTIMLHTGLHDEYHRPSDDVHTVNFAGIEPVTGLTLGLMLAIADQPQPPAFRPECRGETNAGRRQLEAPIPNAVATHRGRWGISTREDAADPAAPLIVRVVPDTPAAAGGLLPGDRIVAIDGKAVASQAEMMARLATAGPRVLLDIERRGRLTSATLEARD